MMNTSYHVAGPDIVFENFGGELVVLNIATGRYFGFNPSAGRVWAALMAGASPDSIAESGFDAAALQAFVAKLIEHALLAPVAAGPVPAPSQLREMLGSDMSAPSVEVFEDLADLIVADPIHEVNEEQGWPKLSKAA